MNQPQPQPASNLNQPLGQRTPAPYNTSPTLQVPGQVLGLRILPVPATQYSVNRRDQTASPGYQQPLTQRSIQGPIIMTGMVLPGSVLPSIKRLPEPYQISI